MTLATTLSTVQKKLIRYVDSTFLLTYIDLLAMNVTMIVITLNDKYENRSRIQQYKMFLRKRNILLFIWYGSYFYYTIIR